MIHKYSEAVGNIMHQEGTEIRNLKRTKSLSPLIKSIIPTKAGKTMNSVKWKKITPYPEHIWKLKSETVVRGHTRDTSERRRRLKTLIKKMSPVCTDKTGKKNVSKFPRKCSSFFLPLPFSEWFSKLPYEQNGAWNRQNGASAFFFPLWNILMELLLPAFCTKIIWFFHTLRKENFKFPVNVVIFNKYHHYVSRYFIIRVFRGCIYLVVPYPVRLGTISTFMV